MKTIEEDIEIKFKDVNCLHKVCQTSTPACFLRCQDIAARLRFFMFF